MSKPKVAFYWCASCGGCEEAVVDLAEGILAVIEAVDIVFWPVAMDFKKSDIVALPDQALFATLLNGAIRTSEQEEMARLLRQKSQHLIAYGACACHGGVGAVGRRLRLPRRRPGTCQPVLARAAAPFRLRRGADPRPRRQNPSPAHNSQ